MSAVLSTKHLVEVEVKLDEQGYRDGHDEEGNAVKLHIARSNDGSRTMWIRVNLENRCIQLAEYLITKGSDDRLSYSVYASWEEWEVTGWETFLQWWGKNVDKHLHKYK